MPKIQNTLDELLVRNQRTIEIALRKWFRFTEEQIQNDLRSKYEKARKSSSTITAELTDWDVIEAEGVKTITPAGVKIMQSGGNAAYRHLAVEGSFDILNVPAIEAVNKFGAKLVTNVTEKTKDGINTYIKHGIKEGHSMGKVAKDLRPLVGLTGPQTQAVINYRALLIEKRPDLSVAKIDRAVMKYTSKTYRQRMLIIARTETANAQNIGYCRGLGQVGVIEAELINGANPCEECILLNGTKYPIKEAEGIIVVHPRCTCAMLPVINDKIISERLKRPHPKLSSI